MDFSEKNKFAFSAGVFAPRRTLVRLTGQNHPLRTFLPIPTQTQAELLKTRFLTAPL